MMEQCLLCVGHLFFKPLPDETFSCCKRHGETVNDINLQKGVSSVIEKHSLENTLCKKFKRGKGVCHTSKKHPFLLHPIREDGEKKLLILLT